MINKFLKPYEKSSKVQIASKNNQVMFILTPGMTKTDVRTILSKELTKNKDIKILSISIKRLPAKLNRGPRGKGIRTRRTEKRIAIVTFSGDLNKLTEADTAKNTKK